MGERRTLVGQNNETEFGSRCRTALLLPISLSACGLCRYLGATLPEFISNYLPAAINPEFGTSEDTAQPLFRMLAASERAIIA